MVTIFMKIKTCTPVINKALELGGYQRKIRNDPGIHGGYYVHDGLRPRYGCILLPDIKSLDGCTIKRVPSAISSS